MVLNAGDSTGIPKLAMHCVSTPSELACYIVHSTTPAPLAELDGVGSTRYSRSAAKVRHAPLGVGRRRYSEQRLGLSVIVVEGFEDDGGRSGFARCGARPGGRCRTP